MRPRCRGADRILIIRKEILFIVLRWAIYGPPYWPYPYGSRRRPVFSKTSAEDLRAILTAYRTVKNGSWPQMHAAMERRASHWALAGEPEMAAELASYVKETETPESAVRVFWKLGP